jgi:hypothetical protein
VIDAAILSQCSIFLTSSVHFSHMGNSASKGDQPKRSRFVQRPSALPGPAPRHGRIQVFNVRHLMSSNQTARWRLLLLEAAHFCWMAAPNAIEPCRESPDRTRLRA